MEIDQGSTPDDMEKLEWDEFEPTTSSGAEIRQSEQTSEDDSLYYYYAKTFENTGEFLAHSQLECCASCRAQDPHLFDSDMMTPLHYAAAWGHADCVRILLEHNAPINVVNSVGYTPLHVGAGSVEVVRLLIKHGALINAKTLSDGKTALHLAIESRCQEAAHVILQTNVNINETDDDNETPLMTAIVCGLLPLAKELIERGARLNLQDKLDRTALYYAVVGRHLGIAQMLLERGARRLTAQHLLHRCVRYNDRPLVELLIRYGDGLCVRDEDNHTPILVAIHQQLPGMLSYLLDVAEQHKQQGIYSDCQEQGLLLFAVQNIVDVKSFQAVLRVLLAKLESARRDLYSSYAPTIVCGLIYCQTPLSRAINLQHLDIAELLIQEGCNLAQICREHVVNELRSNCSPRSLAFGRLLHHAGFKFPHKQRASPCSWSRQRLQFEQQMSQLGSQPQTLQSLARQSIRQRLLLQLQRRPELQRKYRPTGEQSTLALIVNELCIPAVLKGYLSHYADLPAVKDIEEEVNGRSLWDMGM
ncbi:ankyrin repeat, PH and SEC7 domain containing protein secG [Scaptodrosophila lebanonensis]|uniref:Ankyrin repeat, PH and SEC7 domain containing protein secG n=1 Tax=Drosophila lebanonensis TaxID=7225 RepID=A0A6J2U8S7_DROLE|nr:ankyrin repeat, PH and SEC7 domain containing protein secG [Scaptodrosophila lebanonensis]